MKLTIPELIIERGENEKRIAELEADAVNNARAFEDMLAANRAQAAELIELRTRLEILDNG